MLCLERNTMSVVGKSGSRGGTPTKQECIPVGCVPSSAVAVSRGGGGVVCSREGCLLRGGCLLPGGCLLLGVSAPGGSAPRGVSAPGGACLLPGGICTQGVSAPGGGCGISACTGEDTPPCGQTDACKNITFATSLRTVNIRWLPKVGALMSFGVR